MSFYETSSGQIVRGEPVRLPVLAVVWTGSEKAGWRQDGEPRVLGEVASLRAVRDLLSEHLLTHRERSGGRIDTAQIVHMVLGAGEKTWPAYIKVDAMSVVRAAQHPSDRRTG